MPMVPQEAGSSPSAGPEHIPSPPERPSSVTHSYSSGTISAAVPMNDIPPNISSTSRAKQSPILQRLWGKLGLNRLVVMFMVKGMYI
jgi:hypothetical protein